MQCLVCHATTNGEVCAQCGFDGSTRDPARILAARAAFQQRTTAFAPDTRVTRRDKLLPWLGLLLGMALLVFWVHTCLR